MTLPKTTFSVFIFLKDNQNRHEIEKQNREASPWTPKTKLFEGRSLEGRDWSMTQPSLEIPTKTGFGAI